MALAVKLTSAGPVFFRQRRPGRDGNEFSILKFRTMVADAQQLGPVLTRSFDPRITWLGRYLRKWKLDELPQLFNVLRGEMSFVGPRPQPTKLWKDPSISRDAAIVLSVRPGITSEATLIFRNEEEVLAPLSPDEVEAVYLQTLMPLKLRMEVQYLRRASFRSDLRVVLRTFGRLFTRHQAQDNLLKEYLPHANGSGVDRNELSSPNSSSVPASQEIKGLSMMERGSRSGTKNTTARLPDAHAD